MNVLILLNVISIFFILQIDLKLIPLFPNVFNDETTNHINKFISNISMGVLVSSIFYYVVVYIPNQKKKKKTIQVLEKVLSTITYTYAETRIFGHETPISTTKTDYIKDSYINNSIDLMKSKNECLNVFFDFHRNRTEPEFKLLNEIAMSMASKNYLALKLTHDTACTRLSDFENCLTLVNTLSPNIAQQWLIIIDKVRLMKRNRKKHFSKKQTILSISKEKYSGFNFSAKDVYWFSTMIFGYLEYCEAVAEWNRLIKNI